MNNTLSNSDNYQKKLDNSVSEIFNNYTLLINEYSNFFIDNTFIQKLSYFKYVYLKGIETISSVFKLLLLYTKNLPLTIFHCQKSFYYYIEFIGQIGDSNHQFLQLNSKDASLFVFKKTVFEINNDHRKIYATPSESELETYNCINTIIQYFNSLIKYSLNKNIIEDKIIREKQMKLNCDSIIKITNKMISYMNHGKNDTLDSEKISIINNFLDIIVTKDIEVNNLLDIIDHLHKKLNKSTTDVNNIQNNIYSSKLYDNCSKLSTTKFVNWIIN